MRALEKHYVQQALAKGATDPKFAAISVLQRFDGALRIFPHWHVLVADGAWHNTATGLKFLRSLPMRTDQVETLLADIIKRVTLQAQRFYARRADADGTLKPGDPALAALLQGSLFGPQELQRTEPATGSSGVSTFQTKSRNCVDSLGFNLHAQCLVFWQPCMNWPVTAWSMSCGTFAGPPSRRSGSWRREHTTSSSTSRILGGEA